MRQDKQRTSASQGLENQMNKIFLAAIATTFAFTSFNAQASNLCDNIHKISKIVMEKRQDGIAFNEALAITEPLRQSDEFAVKSIGTMAELITVFAYKEQIKKSDVDKHLATRVFAIEQENICKSGRGEI